MSDNGNLEMRVTPEGGLEVRMPQQTLIKIPSEFDRGSLDALGCYAGQISAGGGATIEADASVLLRETVKALKEVRHLVMIQVGIRVHLCPDCYALFDADTEHTCDA